MIRKITAYLIITLGVFIFLYLNSLHVNMKGYFQLVALVSFLIISLGIWLFSIGKKKFKPPFHATKFKIDTQLIEKGEKIQVDFKDCFVLTRVNQEKFIDDSEFAKKWLEKYKKFEKELLFEGQSLIIFELPGNLFKSPLIPKDRESLLFLLEKKGKIDLYLDKNDADRYYVDLSFLN